MAWRDLKIICRRSEKPEMRGRTPYTCAMREFSPIVSLGHPFCTLAQVAVLLRINEPTAYYRYQTGQLDHLLVRLPDGTSWRPSRHLCFNAWKLRSLLDEKGLELFESWQRGELELSDAAGAEGRRS